MSKHNKEYFDAFRREIDAAVAEIAKRRNLKIAAGNITLEDERNFKITLLVKEGDSKVAEATERAKWNQECRMYGLDPLDFKRAFYYKGKMYRVSGIDIGKRCPIKTDSNVSFSVNLFKSLTDS